MDPRYRRALLFGLFGVALLANPLYLYPANVSYEETYTYEARETDGVGVERTVESRDRRDATRGVDRRGRTPLARR